jgi:hypothetical protein
VNWSISITITMVGIIIVFGSLFLLSLFIFLYPKLFLKNIITSANKNLLMDPSNPVKCAFKINEPNETEIVAVITAAITALSDDTEIGYSSKIVIKKIRKIDEINPVWNKTGRLESLN